MANVMILTLNQYMWNSFQLFVLESKDCIDLRSLKLPKKYESRLVTISAPRNAAMKFPPAVRNQIIRKSGNLKFWEPSVIVVLTIFETCWVRVYLYTYANKTKHLKNSFKFKVGSNFFRPRSHMYFAHLILIQIRWFVWRWEITS